jgi:hypothetical protein
MEESGVIPKYVELLASKLDFDRALSRRVRQEVADHLHEAVAADCAGNGLEAERRAIENFGDPHVIAAQFAVVSLAKQTQKVGIAVILMIAGVFIAMKARMAWYALTQWALSDEAKAVSAIVGLIDRYTFWLSIVVGIACWAYISSRRTPTAFHPSYRKQLHRFLVLCSIATCGLIASVISDGILTALRLLETEFSVDFLVPIFSMAIEIVFASVLAFRIRSIGERMALTAALLRT